MKFACRSGASIAAAAATLILAGAAVAPASYAAEASVLAQEDALAAYSKAQSEMNPRGHVVSEPHRHRSSGMLPHRIERGEFNDPYWTPCDYSTDWGPDSCG